MSCYEPKVESIKRRVWASDLFFENEIEISVQHFYNTRDREVLIAESPGIPP